MSSQILFDSCADYRPFKVGDWTVDPAAGQISRDGILVKLEPKVMEVLSYLASRQGELVTRDDIERDVWKGAVISYDSITTAVIKLRKALTDDARQPKYIATVPKRGYRLIAEVTNLPGGEGREMAREDLISGSPRKRSHSLLSGPYLWAFSLTAVLTAILLFYANRHEREGVVTAQLPPSILIVPFTNLSNDPEQEFFADGMTDDVITDLSRLSNLRVFSSDTSSVYKGREVRAKEIGAELGADYVLSGSVRRDGDSIRINAQLIDAKTGLQKWASRFDKRLVDVFTVQDVVTISIAPNYADRYALLAFISNDMGEPEPALDFTTRGMQLNPYYTWHYPYNQGRAYYTLGRYNEAILSLSGALEVNENALPARLFLAVSYMHVDRQDDAEWEIEQIRVLEPSARLAEIRNIIPIQKPELMESFLTDLRNAGMPE